MRTTGVVGFILVVIALTVAPGQAQKGVNVFTATLAGEHEVPLVSSPAVGTFRAVIDETAETVSYELSYSGFTTAVRQAHIHIAQPFASGSIMVWLCDSAANPAPATVDVDPCPQGEGTVTGTIKASDVGTGSSAQGVSVGEFAEFIAAIRGGNAYANVHSAQSGGGEIRGQLKPGEGPK
jgi:hypothetical protein